MEHFSFRDLKVWQAGKQLAVEVTKALSNCRDFGFLNQISRSSLSVPSNIAEGYERKGRAEFIQFLYIAKGSCAELITQIEIGQELEYFTSENATAYLEQAE
jgi:four helix bundle protein